MKQFYCSKYVAKQAKNGQPIAGFMLPTCTQDCKANYIDRIDRKPCIWQVDLDDIDDFLIKVLDRIIVTQGLETIDRLEYAQELP